MLLAVDVGNTQTVLGLFEGERLADSFRLATDRSRTGDELGVTLGALFELEDATGSPVVRLARAVAVMEADGADAGLGLLEGLESQLPRHHRLPAVRAELLVRAGRAAEAWAAFEQAIALCSNDAERDHLRRRQDGLAQ